MEAAQNLLKAGENEEKTAVHRTILVPAPIFIEAPEGITEVTTVHRVALPPTWVATFPANSVRVFKIVSKQRLFTFTS